MAYKKAAATRVWGHNLSILARMHLLPRKGRSLMVEHSLGVQIIHIHHIHVLFELGMRKKKKKQKRTKSKFSSSIFLTVRRSNGKSGAIFYIRIAKDFHL